MRVAYTPLQASPKAAPPVAPEKVEVFTAAPPTRKYVELGTMLSEHAPTATNEDMFQAMRVEAAKRGCDGLVVTQRGLHEAVAACIAYSD